jgi:hypothetical protein
MAKYASKVVQQAIAWLGLNESSGTHKKIIDIYNAQKPLPVGYKVKYTDAWCATFVSAVAVELGYTDIIPTECSCPRMITLFQKKGIWVEDENRTPNPGDIIFYDWEDKGVGDNMGSSDHVGIVEKVSGGKITIIEGNYSNSVKRRTLSVNGRYIRGYGVPKYDAENGTAAPEKETPTATTSNEVKTATVELKVLKKGSKNNQVKTLQRILHCMGYSLGTNPIDGDFGKKTDAAVRSFQKNNKLEEDGIVGAKTWAKLLRG